MHRVALHAFVDESKKRDYIVAAALITSDDVTAARRAMRDLRIGKQQRIHFKDEDDSRKKQIITAVLSVSAGCRIYVCRTRRSAREHCLTCMVPDLVDLGVGRLVLERDESTEQLDKRILYAQLRKAGSSMNYQHDSPHREPMLWAPDAVAWCWASGGDWRKRVADHVDVHEAG